MHKQFCRAFSVCIFLLFFLVEYSEGNKNYWDPNYEAVSRQRTKQCNYQSKVLVIEDFLATAGFGCYSYSNKAMFHDKPLSSVTVMGKKDRIEAGIMNLTTHQDLFLFDYKNSTVQEYILSSYKKKKYLQKWINCCKMAEDCCENEMTNDIIVTNGTYCPAIWDAWNCFKPGSFETNSSHYCPEYIFIGDPPCLPTSYKFCNSDGTWNRKTDYSTCIYSQIVRSRYEFHIISLYVSIALCIPAIIIFLIYPSLRITRVALHRNLLIAIVVKNILVIVSKIYITLDSVPAVEGGPIGTVLINNGVPCRVLAFFERVGVNAMYACMVVDGFYLHRIIVTVFKKDPPVFLLYIAVAVLSLVPILIWAAVKATLDNVKCWIVDESWYFWIIDSSRYAMLGVNLLLLLDIIRVLVWKLKKSSTLQHIKYYYVSVKGHMSLKQVILKAFLNTLRATFILLPLFGIQFILISQRPKNADCKWDNVFHYVSFIIDASQGILVSCLYCYFNNEVQLLLKKSFQNTKTNLGIRFSQDKNASSVARRSTAATYVSKEDNRSARTSRL